MKLSKTWQDIVYERDDQGKPIKTLGEDYKFDHYVVKCVRMLNDDIQIDICLHLNSKIKRKGVSE